MGHRTVNQLLGHSDEARLLIINADDFGMSHAGNAGTIKAFREGLLTSTTLMAPCPWAQHAIGLLREHPDLPFGVHLTIVSEHDAVRWGPLASRNQVPSLLDDDGYFFRNSQSEVLLARARIEEIEIEYRAQIAAVVSAGLQPTHFDWHCLYDGGRNDIFELTASLAREFRVAMRVHDRRKAADLIAAGLPAVDMGVLDSYSLDIDGKHDRLVQLLRELPPGLSEWAVHPSLGDAEAKAMEPDAWQVRRTDLDFLVSPYARRIIEEEQIVLLDYCGLRKVWASR